MKTIYCHQINMKTVSEGNSSENPFAKANRHREQKKRIKQLFITEKIEIKPPCEVILTRIAPRSLDEHDNLRMAFKWIVDAIAENIKKNYVPGRADDDKTITWTYRQESGKPKEYAVKIEFIKDD